MLRYFLLIIIFSGFLTVSTQSQNYSLLTSPAADYAQLNKGFVTPPNESRLRCYWWWLNSMATKESITRDLEQMKSHGYGALQTCHQRSTTVGDRIKCQYPELMESGGTDHYS
jgi:hypothetical protein